MMDWELCPKCSCAVVYSAVFNPRNSKYTILPLDLRAEPAEGEHRFDLKLDKYETVNLAGEPAGAYYLATPGYGAYTPHAPSHYTEALHEH